MFFLTALEKTSETLSTELPLAVVEGRAATYQSPLAVVGGRAAPYQPQLTVVGGRAAPYQPPLAVVGGRAAIRSCVMLACTVLIPWTATTRVPLCTMLLRLATARLPLDGRWLTWAGVC